MKKVITFIFITVTYAFMFSCRVPSLSDDYVDEEDFARKDELFIDVENDLSRFLVSDEKYKNNGRGSTLWCVKDNDKKDAWECYIQKQSGDKEAGFGIVFCVSELEEKNYMLVLLLNMQGKYQIGKACNGEYSVKMDWQSSSVLNTGASGNLIGIKKEGAEFVISFNSVVETRFTDEDEPSLISGGMGYIAVVSPYEKFPENPVEINYKMK